MVTRPMLGQADTRQAGLSRCAAHVVRADLVCMNTTTPIRSSLAVDPLQWAFALCALLAMLSSHFGYFTAYAVLKPLSMCLAMACVWQLSDRTAHAPWVYWLMAALGCSLAGDVFLLIPEGFILGLLAFLLAHVCYIAVFTRDAPWLPSKPALAFSALAGIAVYACLLQHGLPDDLRIPVATYVLVIAWMSAQALGRATILRNTGACCVALGAVSFMVSDTILAINKFAQPVPAVELWVLSSYYLAQWLIVHGMLHVLRQPVRQ